MVARHLLCWLSSPVWLRLCHRDTACWHKKFRVVKSRNAVQKVVESSNQRMLAPWASGDNLAAAAEYPRLRHIIAARRAGIELSS